MIITRGDLDGDGDHDEIHSFGARSITIWDTDGRFVADTGDVMAQKTAELTRFCEAEIEVCSGFNSTDDESGSFADRIDDKGPEPEGAALGRLRAARYAFVGLERADGNMIFDVSDPHNPSYAMRTGRCPCSRINCPVNVY